MVNKKIVLRFPPHTVEQPVIYRLAKDFDLEFNILKANIVPDEEGLLVIELVGTQENFDRGFEYLKSFNIGIEPLNKDVVRNDAKCSHCGACVTVCPVGAFSVDAKTRKILFDGEKCIACELCITSCPLRAMTINL